MFLATLIQLYLPKVRLFSVNWTNRNWYFFTIWAKKVRKEAACQIKSWKWKNISLYSASCVFTKRWKFCSMIFVQHQLNWGFFYKSLENTKRYYDHILSKKMSTLTATVNVITLVWRDFCHDSNSWCKYFGVKGQMAPQKP